MLKQDKGVLNGAFSYTIFFGQIGGQRKQYRFVKKCFFFLFELEELKYETA